MMTYHPTSQSVAAFQAAKIQSSTALSARTRFLFSVTTVTYRITERLSWYVITELREGCRRMGASAAGGTQLVASVTTKYRDLAMLVGFGLQLWEYGTPIAYGLQLVPERLYYLYMLNPVTPIVTTFRYAMFGFGYFRLRYYLIGWGVSLLVFLIGLILFNRIERTFMDTI